MEQTTTTLTINDLIGSRDEDIEKGHTELRSLLDNSQYEAVTDDSHEVLLRAPAGSGKTTTIIAAVVDYRFNHPDDRICAITYTRAAREEMEERLKKFGVRDVEVTTIHVWARNLLQFFSKKYGFQISILNELDVKRILEKIVENYRLRRHINKNAINIDVLFLYINGNKNMDIPDAIKNRFKALENAYIEYKRDNNLYDYTDYPLYLHDVLSVYHDKIYGIDALFVDEFQDVDEIQLEIFNEVQTNKKFYCGDPRQSIFLFRGADGEVFNKLRNQFTNYHLQYNYRSYQCIINYANTVYDILADKFDRGEDYKNLYILQVDDICQPSPIICERGDKEGFVDLITIDGEYKTLEADELVFNEVWDKSWEEAIDNMMSLNPHILCRTNKEVKQIINDGGYYEVSTIHAAKGLEYPYVIVIDSPIDSKEDLNVAYVALTRAQRGIMVVPREYFMRWCRRKGRKW